MAGLVLVVLLPLYLFLFYYRPADKQMRAYGAAEKSAKMTLKAVAAAPDWTLRKAFKTYQLWLLVFSDFCFWGLGNYLIIAHQIKFSEDAGFSSIVATGVFALFGVISIIGQVGAFLSDTIGREKAVLAGVVLAMLGLGALMSVHDTSQMWLLYVYAVSSGFATGLFSPTIVAGMADIFHGRNIGAISALLLTGVGLGGAIGPWLGGYLYDISGTYQVAFLISMGAYALAGISLWIAAPRNADKLRAKMLR